MGVAADCAYVATYGGQGNATTQILTNWNSASSLYKVCFEISSRHCLTNSIFAVYRAHLMLVSGLPNFKFEIKR